MGYLQGCTDIERPVSLRDAGLKSDTAKRRRFNNASETRYQDITGALPEQGNEKQINPCRKATSC